MERRRAAAVPVGLVLIALAACSTGSPETTPSPTFVPIGTPRGALAKVSATSSPALVDRNCIDFALPDEAQEFYIEAGGPDQDLHGLDPDRNGNACDEPGTQVPAGAATPPAPTTSATVIVGVASTPQPTAGPPRSVHSSSGAVDGKSGGSDSHSSCESSDETRCD